ncbi:hypothetical protein NDU88_005622 [Pleurodeles waltl]|uniref:Uncharacterized protein n=1 Tax=Pleurodeles waltl TaxID=8319 RepID=A0AAV7SM62_PLEWA|nr:hypothetical protein NDU88_005622 [Pleurodeles waltl]
MFPPDYIYLRSKVPKLQPIDSTRIPSAVKSRKCDAFGDIYTNMKEPRERERGVTEGGTAGDPACSDQQLCEPWGRLPLEIPVAGGRERACVGRARPAVAASDRTAEEAAGGRH